MDKKIREKIASYFNGQFPTHKVDMTCVEHAGDALVNLAKECGLSEEEAQKYAKQVMIYATNVLGYCLSKGIF